MKLKNSLKEENVKLKNEQEEAEKRHKKLREKFRQTKHELEECLRLQSEQQTELEAARERIDVRIYLYAKFTTFLSNKLCQPWKSLNLTTVNCFEVL